MKPSVSFSTHCRHTVAASRTEHLTICAYAAFSAVAAFMISLTASAKSTASAACATQNTSTKASAAPCPFMPAFIHFSVTPSFIFYPL